MPLPLADADPSQGIIHGLQSRLSTLKSRDHTLVHNCNSSKIEVK